MAHKIFILVLFLSSISVPTHVDGFIALEVFRKGIDFAKDLITNTAVSELTPLELPKIEQTLKIPLVATVHFTVSNMVLSEVNVSSSTLELGDDSLNFVVSGAKAYLSMDWSYHYGHLIIVSDKGVASVEVKSMEVGLTIGLKNQQGTLQLSLLDYGCYVKDISIKLNGGASWLYQALVDVFDKRVRSAVEDAVSDKIKDGVQEINSLLQSLPKEVEIGETASLNVTFVNDHVFSNSSIGLEIDGLFTGHDQVLALPGDARKLAALVPCQGPAKMAGVSIHEDVLNSASTVYFNAGIMHYVVDELPKSSLLNTTEWKHIIPRLYKQYPNEDMNLNLTVTSAPVIRVGSKRIDATVNVDVTLDVLDAGQAIPVACFSVVITVSGMPEITGNTLSGSVKLRDFSLSLKWSKVGRFHMTLLESLIEVSLETVVVPYVNVFLYEGLSLPDVKGYTLQNARISCNAQRIVACSDVGSVQQRLLNNPVMVS